MNNRALFWCICILAFYLYATAQRNEVWRGGGMSIWKDVTEKSPNKPRGFLNLGNEYMYRRSCDDAEKNYRKAVALIKSIENTADAPLFNLGAAALSNIAACRLDQGRLMDAAEPLIEAMRDFSPNAEVLTNLTVFYLRQRDLPNALKTSESALKYFPNKSGLLYNYGQTLQFMGRCDDAAKAYRAAYLADRTMDFPKLPECVQ